jgi:hypothetical protein
MNRKLTLPAFALALMVGVTACGELDVANPNEADRERALASPDDVETLIASAFQQYFGVTHYWRSNAMALNHMSSRHTATWGNFGMNDLGREPREALPNQASYSYAYAIEDAWQDNYGGISAASDGIRALDAGLEIGPGGERNARARAFATFIQGLSSCNLGLHYDQAFIIDETVDIGGDLVTIDYNAMQSYALGKLSEAESLARSSSFTLEDNWINGNPMNNTDLADLIVSYRARCAANQPRTPGEAANVNWTQVAADAANGMNELIIDGPDASGNTAWFDGIKTYGMENGTWHRMHMDWAGMAVDRDAESYGASDDVRRHAVSCGQRGWYGRHVPPLQRHDHLPSRARHVSSVALWGSALERVPRQLLGLLVRPDPRDYPGRDASVRGRGGLPYGQHRHHGRDRERDSCRERRSAAGRRWRNRSGRCELHAAQALRRDGCLW